MPAGERRFLYSLISLCLSFSEPLGATKVILKRLERSPEEIDLKILKRHVNLVNVVANSSC